MLHLDVGKPRRSAWTNRHVGWRLQWRMAKSLVPASCACGALLFQGQKRLLWGGEIQEDPQATYCSNRNGETD